MAVKGQGQIGFPECIDSRLNTSTLDTAGSVNIELSDIQCYVHHSERL